MPSPWDQRPERPKPAEEPLPPSLSQQTIQGVHDATALVVEGCHIFAKLVVGNRSNFERMQNRLILLDPEGRVEASIADLADTAIFDHGHNNRAPIAVVQRRLDQNYIGNIVPMLSRVPLHIEPSLRVRSQG